MKYVRNWNDLKAFGIDALTGEACGLSYRILCDVTAKGGKILAKAFGVNDFCLQPPWNSAREGEDEHIGSIMLAPEMLKCVGIFALLESGCTEVLLPQDATPIGIEAADGMDKVQEIVDAYGPCRRFAYRGTAGDRNVHQMSGRVV